MLLINENLDYYTPWSGAVDRYERILDERGQEALENLLTELYPEGITTGALNDLIWHDHEFIFECLGMKTERELYDEPEEDEEEDEEDEEDAYEKAIENIDNIFEEED